MKSGLKNAVALVTGSGRGIGRATALALAAEGCKIALISRTEKELNSVAAEVKSLGSQALVFCADVSNEPSVERFFRAVTDAWGAPDILINNAAIFSYSLIEETSVKDWDEVMAVNVRGVFLCSRQFFRGCISSKKGGSIVNISSLGGVRGTEKFAGLLSYTASKFAVVGITEGLAVEGRPHGIRVNCLAPGAVDTEMLRRAAPHLQTQTKPEHVAKTILYLADESRSGHLTGSVIEVFSNAT